MEKRCSTITIPKDKELIQALFEIREKLNESWVFISRNIFDDLSEYDPITSYNEGQYVMGFFKENQKLENSGFINQLMINEFGIHEDNSWLYIGMMGTCKNINGIVSDPNVYSMAQNPKEMIIIEKE